MNLHEFLIAPDVASQVAGPHDRIVLSSRVRLARSETAVEAEVVVLERKKRKGFIEFSLAL